VKNPGLEATDARRNFRRNQIQDEPRAEGLWGTRVSSQYARKTKKTQLGSVQNKRWVDFP